MPKQILFEDIRHEGCEHCPHNKDAKKPYRKMKEIDVLGEAWIKGLEKLGKEIGLNANCILCLSVHRLMDMPEQDLLKVLEGTKLENR